MKPFIAVGCLVAAFAGPATPPLAAASGFDAASHGKRMAEGLGLFKERVRAILEQNCLECHGGEKIEGEFELSNRESFFASGLAGDSAETSDLMDVIRHRFEPYMPHERDQLPEEEIEAIARWLDLGAPYDRPLVEDAERIESGRLEVTDDDRNYWAYRQLTQPPLPEVSREGWAHNEIDGFVLKRLEDAGIEPHFRASGRRLIRRVYLNTLGLPPTPDEVAAFVNDFQPGAYERMVDRVLDSPHFGERWARHWMDIARFAESTGFEIDFDRPYAYHYRDFLIEAFNRNMPYDQFVAWQVAGDELAPENPLALAATGFLGAGAFPSVLTEREFESARYDELDDMVNTLGTAMLGTTVGCARCHDHKFDPVTMDDYYALAANFTQTVRGYVDYDPRAESYQKAMQTWRENLGQLRKELEVLEAGVIEDSFQAWLEKGDFTIPLERWLIMDPLQWTSLQDVEMEKQCDSSMLLTGRNPEQETENLIFEFETRLKDVAGLRMEALTHPTLPGQGPGRDHEGGFTIREVKVHIQDSGTRDAGWKPVELASAEATARENETSLSAAAAINGVSQGWSIGLDAFGKDQALVIRFAQPLGFAGGSRLKVTVSSGYNIQQMVGRPRFSITQDPRAPVEVSEGIPLPAYEGLLKLLVGADAGELTENERGALRRWHARNHPEWLALQEKIRAHAWNRPVSTKTRIQVSGDRRPPVWHRSVTKGFPSRYERTYRLDRGDVDQKREPAYPGVPQVLNPTGVRSNPLVNPRRSLAAWLTDVETGAGSLLARVFVNRVWHYHFGTGLVDTPGDFGKRGGAPSHPALLEWLAWDFVKHGWDVKRLQRQILTSAAYRRSSVHDPEKARVDEANRLLWRFPPRRLEAEAIRDSLLQVSGLLDRRMFGPGSRDPAMNRRSVYFFIKRGALIPEMLLFDWPEHLVGIGRRSATTIAPQALQFMNSPRSRKYAEGFADRLSGIEAGEARIRQAYQIAFSRFPDEEEVRLGKAFVKARTEAYPADEYGKEAAWIDYCHSLLSLNEFLYIR